MLRSRLYLRLALTLVTFTAGFMTNKDDRYIYVLFIAVGVELFFFIQSIRQGLKFAEIMKFVLAVMYYSLLVGIGFALVHQP